MQSQSPSKSGASRLWFLLAASVLLVLVAGAFWAKRYVAEPSYNRFVSRPLPDGSRYTFRYPSWIDSPSEQPPDVFAVWSSRVNTFAAFAINLQRRQGRQQPVFRGINLVAGYQRWPGVKIGADVRRETRGTKNGRFFHDVIIKQKRTRTWFTLSYNGSAVERARFQETAPVVAASFRVLPPGAPVPSP